MQDSGECVGALGQLGETMLHETKANDQTQRNGSPTGDRKSTQRIERNVPQRFLNRCSSIGSSYHCILVVLIVPFSSSAPRRTCSQPLAVFSVRASLSPTAFIFFSLLLDHALPIDQLMFRDRARSIRDECQDGARAANDICDRTL